MCGLLIKMSPTKAVHQTIHESLHDKPGKSHTGSAKQAHVNM